MKKYVSLCSGYGGLDLVVESLTGAESMAYAETDPAASKVMAHHWPGVPNLGDLAVIDWSEWTDADYLCAGFPCQDISNAGTREGITGGRSSVWKHVAEAVCVIRPELVFLENVAAIKGRGLDVVAEDLAAIGYDLRWTCLRASQLGAAHHRDRWFGLARPGVQDPHS